MLKSAIGFLFLGTLALAGCSGEGGGTLAGGTSEQQAALRAEAPATAVAPALREEHKARFEEMKAQRFARMDKDQSGALDAAEVGEKAWSHLKAADANGDGKVTKDELAQAHASGKLGELGHRPHGPRDPGALIQRFDKNGDGALEASEVPDRMQKHFADLDADHDGKVTVAELSAKFAAHKPFGHRRPDQAVAPAEKPQ